MKGLSLAEMTALGLNVPPGFIIPTDAGFDILKGNIDIRELLYEVRSEVSRIENTMDRWFASRNPLLLSIRSGASVMMPGMMDTILNVGMNREVIASLLDEGMSEYFVFDCYRRFTRMYGETVLGIKPYKFDAATQDMLNHAGMFSEEEFDSNHHRKLADNYREIIRKETGSSIPDNPYDQVKEAIVAVIRSWENPRAVVYRNLRRISHDLGSAVIVQGMVFGNLDDRSASGVVTTRDPIVGAKQLFGEYLLRSQGEDVLAGTRTPKKISELQGDLFPVYSELEKVAEKLEHHFQEAQEIEFTIESGKLYILQTHTAQCTAQAKIKISVDMVNEGLLSKEKAVLSIEPESLDQILHNFIDPKVQMRSIMKGLPASPGGASGAVVFDIKEAARYIKQSREAILVRAETITDDVEAMELATGILTGHGGVTSHAAVVARRMGKPCITGCESMNIDIDRGEIRVGDLTIKRGDIITIDGSSGRVFLGTVPMRKTSISTEFRVLLSWADEMRTMKVRANADTPEDAQRAIEFGAEGIGLCRTEAMFMAADRLPAMRTLILEESSEERDRMLVQLEEFQRNDFLEIFRALNGKPVTIRLLDPPLHEFLPNAEQLTKEVAVMRSQGEAGEELRRKERLLKRVLSHQEINPMLGLRGCRLGIINPGIIEMQVRAVVEAACELITEGIETRPEIMIPLVGHVREFEWIRERLDNLIGKLMEEKNVTLHYRIGVLIEIPRAALTAGALAQKADFFSFGTNDLTQTTFGFSRDDAEHKFLHYYHDQHILDENPFETIDMDGVGRLVRIATHDGRKANSSLTIGLCGEHGGEPRTIAFCHSLGMNYISCSPYRVPIARLAAAQASIRDRLAAAETSPSKNE